MKRLHLHLSVENLEKSTRFYSALFGADPVKQKDDYAKWMLDDPRINFAISTRGKNKGLDHLGLQVEAPEELNELRANMTAAELKLFSEGEATCCYAKSDKSWVKDPDGIAWETYHTMNDVEFFGAEKQEPQDSDQSACCAPSNEKTSAKSCC